MTTNSILHMPSTYSWIWGRIYLRIPKESHRTPFIVDDSFCYQLSASLLKLQGSGLGSLHHLQRIYVLKVHMVRENLSKIFQRQGLNLFQLCRPARFCSRNSFCLKAYLIYIVLDQLVWYIWNLEYTVMPDFTTQNF